MRGATKEEAVAALSAAAAAGDPDAMLGLGLLGLREHLAWEWLGDQAAVSDADRREVDAALGWLRAAAERGNAAAMDRLAGLRGLAAHERSYWRHAAAVAGAWHAASRYADELAQDDRWDEAERWYLADAEAGNAYAATRLADLLERAGRVADAREWRSQAAELERPPFRGMAMADIAPILLTAVATTALVPFVQTLAAKVAEDAYAQTRGLLVRLFSRHSTPGPYEGTPHRLLVIADDSEPVEVFVWADVSDEALRALCELDVRALLAHRRAGARTLVVWNAAERSWLVHAADDPA